jgi:hypothetical protein
MTYIVKAKISNKPKRHLINSGLIEHLDLLGISRYDLEHIVNKPGLGLCRAISKPGYKYFIFHNESVKELDEGCFNTFLEKIMNIPSPEETAELLLNYYRNGKLKIIK